MGIRTRLTETLGIKPVGRKSPTTLLVAAGGIADGRGLAACLMLGADGVMLGSRLWASPECLVHPNHQRAALAANGDGTIRQKSAISPAALSGRKSSPDVYCGRRSLRAGTAGRRSIVWWRKPLLGGRG